MRRACLTALALVILHPVTADAYVGPGAGFAFVSSFLVLFASLLMAVVALLVWPLRFTLKGVMRLRRRGKSRVPQVVILGLDGQDPDLTEDFMRKGLMPNFSLLKDKGCFMKLGTTIPAESPVAWSSFQTGCNPGKHRIYDFLTPNRASLLPELSSAHVSAAGRVLRLGKFRIPLGRPRMRARRKSRPFWQLLGEAGYFSSVLRVPITFPPEKLRGVCLSAMCVPDLKGSQGTYSYFTSDSEDRPELTSGVRCALEVKGGAVRGVISGPVNSLVKDGPELTLPFEVVTLPGCDGRAELRLGDECFELVVGRHSPWISLKFNTGLAVKVHGLCRFVLLGVTPAVRLYMTPIHIDPEHPALPISHPAAYSVYLAKSQGPFATLGVAEDTSALNEGVIDEQMFREQCYDIHAEREKMFFDALDKTPRGLVCGVFDLADRMQHMFFRSLTEDHPANRARETSRYAGTIEELYAFLDDLAGRVMKKLTKDAVLIVMSDHGFKTFRREVDLNAWLRDQGWLAVKPEAADADMLQAVDWSATRAFSVGFGGIYLNIRGREAQGIVDPQEAGALCEEIRSRLLQLKDSADGTAAVKRAYLAEEAYSGPYVDDAPDIMAGFTPGYRTAWCTITGGVGAEVIKDNTRPWSGDHNMNPEDIPGILFCNRTVRKPDPHIVDIAPTVLDLFGLRPPGYMDGTSLMPEGHTS